jgi:hypothetical protein
MKGFLKDGPAAGQVVEAGDPPVRRGERPGRPGAPRLPEEGSVTGTTEHDVGQQRIAALQMANAVRRARAELNREIAQGSVSVLDVLHDPPSAADRCSVRELLMSQRHCGRSKTRRLLAHTEISEAKLVGDLTARQRQLLAVQLEAI